MQSKKENVSLTFLSVVLTCGSFKNTVFTPYNICTPLGVSLRRGPT